MKKKKTLWIIIGVLILAAVLGGGGYYWYQNYEVPKQNAISRFNRAVEKVEAENTVFQKKIDEAQSLLDKGEKPYEKAKQDNLQNALNDAKTAMVTIPEQPTETDEINATADQLEKTIDYSKEEEKLQTASAEYSNSVKQQQQITAPSENFILERLKGIDSIVTMAPVTEDNDPNGNLNKAGGYTSTVYFESSNVNQAEVYGTDLIDRGTDAGGAIEVYANSDDAERRNTYLATYDGTILASGSHEVLGTIVIRTSNELTATQQKQLTDAIKTAFLRVDE